MDLEWADTFHINSILGDHCFYCIAYLWSFPPHLNLNLPSSTLSSNLNDPSFWVPKRAYGVALDTLHYYFHAFGIGQSWTLMVSPVISWARPVLFFLGF